MAFVVTAAAIVGAVLVAVLWLVFRPDRGTTRDRDVAQPPGSTTTRTTAETGTTASPTLTSKHPISLPGTDGEGFLDYPFARCEPGDLPAAMALTTKSALVICGYATEFLYYRGVRLSDGAGVELGDAAPSSDGFDVTNPTDGTRYEVRPSELTIVLPDGRRISEPMVQYGSR